MTKVHNLASYQLEVEIGEDPMEITSEFDHKTTMEEDIDIELDLDDDQFREGEDEKMSDDANSLGDEDHMVNYELHPGNDDEMVDDGQIVHPEYDLDFADDEDLLDAEEEYLDLGLSAVQATVSNDEKPHKGVDPDKSKLDQTPHNTDASSIVFESVKAQIWTTSTQVTDSYRQKNDLATTEMNDKDATNSAYLIYEPDDGIEDDLGDEDEDNVNDNEDDEESRNLIEDQKEEPSATQVEVSEAGLGEVASAHQSPRSGSIKADAVHSLPQLDEGNDGDQPDTFGYIATSEPQPDNMSHQGVSSYEPASIHPVIVLYQKNEISLFPPDEEGIDQTYFLKDKSLASESIRELLGACKIVLAESIGEKDELEVKIESLNLDFCESTAESSTTTLAQVLELYLQLQQNDGVENPEPLYMTLITKVRIAQRLEQLYSAVAEGKGFTQVSQFTDFDEADTFNDATGTPSRTDSRDALTDNVAVPVTGTLESWQDIGREFRKSIHQIQDDFSANNLLDEDHKPFEILDKDAEDDDIGRGNGYADKSPLQGHSLQSTHPVQERLQSSHQLDSKSQVEISQDEASPKDDYFEDDDEYHDPSSEFATYPTDEQSFDQNAEQSLANENHLGNTDVDHSLDSQLTEYANVDYPEYQDSIDYEEDERHQGSSAASSTLRGDGSEVTAGPPERVSANPSYKSQEEYIVPAGHEAIVNHKVNSDATNIDTGAHDEGNSVEDVQRILDDSPDKVPNTYKILPDATKVDNLSTSENGHDLAIAVTTEIYTNDDSAYDEDNDEITYSDDDSEELNEDKLRLQNVEDNKERPVTSDLSSPSLKRPRADIENEIFPGDQSTSIKRIRSE